MGISAWTEDYDKILFKRGVLSDVRDWAVVVNKID